MEAFDKKILRGLIAFCIAFALLLGQFLVGFALGFGGVGQTSMVIAFFPIGIIFFVPLIVDAVTILNASGYVIIVLFVLNLILESALVYYVLGKNIHISLAGKKIDLRNVFFLTASIICWTIGYLWTGGFFIVYEQSLFWPFYFIGLIIVLLITYVFLNRAKGYIIP